MSLTLSRRELSVLLQITRAGEVVNLANAYEPKYRMANVRINVWQVEKKRSVTLVAMIASPRPHLHPHNHLTWSDMDWIPLGPIPACHVDNAATA